MTISLSCSCGARLKVRDEAAGKRMKCPKCQAPVVVPEPEPDPGPELRIVDEPMEPAPEAAAPETSPAVNRPRMSRSPVHRPGLRSGGKVAWEVYVVIGLVALNLVLNLLQAAGGKVNLIGLGLNALMLIGLFNRTNWGWWLTVVLSALAMGLCFFLASAVPRELSEAATILYAIGAVYLGVIVLLIVCRARGAYLQ